MTTKAGEELLRQMRAEVSFFIGGSEAAETGYIAAIEAEARTAVLAELRAKVEGLPGLGAGYHPQLRTGFERGRQAVLEAIDKATR